jgi:integrase/recombinase XerD
MERGKRRYLERDEAEMEAVRVWRESHRAESTIGAYLQWVRRFRADCRARGLPELSQLTQAGVDAFALRYRGPRLRRAVPGRVRGPARHALRAWAYVQGRLGRVVPPWEPVPEPTPESPLIAEYVEFRIRHRGVAIGTLVRDRATAKQFLAALRSRNRAVGRARIRDLDRFVTGLAGRLSSRTAADTCSSLRAFLRFLQVTGRMKRDLAALVMAPRVRRVDRPPRALPWTDVRRLLRAADQETPAARRDYALLLLMATYGLGAAEVLALQLEDFDWAGGVVRVRRPKTGVSITLPLLPGVARAVATYLRSGRPPQLDTRALFVTARIPHQPLSGSAIRHLVREHARAAGISAPRLGGHLLRHSHATRQIDSGAHPKIVGDILGHLRPASTSIYIRVALQRLRGVGLPVPR